MKPGISLAFVCLVTVSACATQDAKRTGSQPESPPAATSRTTPPGQPYAGAWLGDAEQGGAVVLGVIAGPAAIAGLQRGDRIVEIDRLEVDAATAYGMIGSSSPGDRLALVVMRNGKPMAMTLVVGTRELWATPGEFASAIPFSATGLPGPDSAAAASRHPREAVLAEALASLPEAEPVAASLERMFATLAADDTGYHKLPLIRTAFTDPAGMSRWSNAIAQTLHPFEFERRAIVDMACETLALKCPAAAAEPAQSVSLQAFALAIGNANARVRGVFARAGAERALAHADLHYLMRTTAADRTLAGQADVLRGIRAMQLSMRVDADALLQAAHDILVNIERIPDTSGQARDAPADLRDSVKGSIIDFIAVDNGYVVIGGPGANRYNMDRLYAVIDAGGDDVYEWTDVVPPETQTIVDLDGDDRYQAGSGGPGAGWLGASVLVDVSGSDKYQSALGGCGAGAFGFGFLFDGGGADSYRCAAWSAGAGLYGAGALVDLGEEADVYDSEVFSQGVGGPRGMGILIDAAGGDFYRANGPVQSAYDTAGSFMGFSQGVGVGIRPYDSGGVGILLDFGGDDRYEGGEFSQGGGYYWGAGLLYDATGDDLYFGSRYAQGFAAHQAFGMLYDLSGDDVYWATAAAGQGAAWDQSIAALFDGDGDDVYRARILSQGAAAQQSRALLRDAAGDDVYRSAGRDTQGAAGDNAYHYRPENPVYSLGVLVDEAGDDRYSSGLLNGETLLRHNAGAPNGRGVAGIARDLQ